MNMKSFLFMDKQITLDNQACNSRQDLGERSEAMSHRPLAISEDLSIQTSDLVSPVHHIHVKTENWHTENWLIASPQCQDVLSLREQTTAFKFFIGQWD